MKTSTITQLGEALHPSPIDLSVEEEKFVPSDVQWPGGHAPEEMMLFEKAGPRKKLFFDPKETRAAIVTCGGLVGTNNVIRSVTTNSSGYDVKSVFGIRGGYRGLDPRRKPIELTDDAVRTFTGRGNPVGTSRARWRPWP